MSACWRTRQVLFAASQLAPRALAWSLSAKGTARVTQGPSPSVSRSQAVVAMRRYSGLGPLDTVLNRSGVFAFAALERRQKDPLNSAFWRESVDAKRAIKVASGIR